MTTTIANVKNILDTELLDANITAYIAMADNMLDAIMAGKTIATAILEDMATWLTAHLIVVSKERQSAKMEIDDTKNTFTGSFGKSLEGTTYGQQVLILDYTGTFANLGKKMVNFYIVPEDDE